MYASLKFHFRHMFVHEFSQLGSNHRHLQLHRRSPVYFLPINQQQKSQPHTIHYSTWGIPVMILYTEYATGIKFQKFFRSQRTCAGCPLSRHIG